LAPVVKSTLIPLKPILCSPVGRGFNIIQMPSDTACVWPGDIPKTLFSGNVTYLVGQHILIGFARTKSRQVRELGYLHLNTLDKSVAIAQYLLAGILAFVLLQVLMFSNFYTSVISAAGVISYFMAIFMMMFLTLRFFSWFRLHKNLVVLF
jgi:hypothetical protein